MTELTLNNIIYAIPNLPQHRIARNHENAKGKKEQAAKLH